MPEMKLHRMHMLYHLVVDVISWNWWNSILLFSGNWRFKYRLFSATQIQLFVPESIGLLHAIGHYTFHYVFL